jgi:hypothetical protein
MYGINGFDDIKIIGAGINSTISISKTIKITANKKNRIENGIRADRIGSNPHSNGDSFSRSLVIRKLIIHARIIRIGGRIIATSLAIVIKFIYQKSKIFL